MKLLIVIFSFIPLFCFAQKDLDKYSKDELVRMINQKDQEYNTLKNNFDKLNKAKEAQANAFADSVEALLEARRQILELKFIIKDNNNVFLKEVFESKYTSKYFEETDLELEDKTEKFANSDILIKSVRVDASRQTLDLVLKALEFNTNYITLFQIRQLVLNEKFNEEKVTEALKRIDSLPSLSPNTKLYNTKNRIISLLKNYKDATCDLKKSLDNLKSKIDQKALAPTYVKYENAPKFKDYPYLVMVISRMKKDVLSYTPDALQPCPGSKDIVADGQPVASQVKIRHQIQTASHNKSR